MKKSSLLKNILAAVAIVAGMQSCIKDYHTPASGVTGEIITINDLRWSYHGATVTLTPGVLNGASKIQGVVISDKDNLNIDAGTIVIQETAASQNAATDLTRGIAIRVDGGASYSYGDSLVVTVTNATLTREKGRLLLTGINTSQVQKVASGKTPLVQDVTLGMLNSFMNNYESTVVAIHADVADYSAGGTISGLHPLDDHTGPVAYIRTRSAASFASTALPVDAQFTGIAGYYNESGNDTSGAKRVIEMRNAADIKFSSGALYANFPESFESPDASVKSSYNSGTNIVALSTGNWYLLQGILATTINSDKFNQPGKQGIRMQQNLSTSGYTQMNFDLPDGASKVTVFYGKYGTDARSSFRFEYSTNGGTTWTAIGSNFTDMPDKGNKCAAATLNISGPVRFRINKIGLGSSNNGRLSLDDFAVYKKL